MQVIVRIATGCVLVASSLARADEAITETAEPEASAQTDLRLTLSTFLFREAGSDAGPLVDMGAAVPSASPVQRYFGDLRMELSDGGFELDARVRQTTSERFQSGAEGGGEYELRTLHLRAGSQATSLVVGRQFIDAVGATKVDGIALERRLSKSVSATLFGGAFPALGSRSLDTDYPEIRNADGSEGSALVPITGGLGTSYTAESVHGSIGAAAVYVMQEVPDATSTEASRVFLTADGYARPARALDIYHFALVDVAGAAGVNLTNGSLGINAHPLANVQISTSVNHVSTDLLQIAARNVLVDPDPNALGVVQNNIAVVRVSQDHVRAATSLALAQARFELSLAGSVRRRPAVDVALADGTTFAFPEARSADVTLGVLDRHSIANLRVAASATVTAPLGDTVARSAGTVVRLAAGRTFAGERGQLEVDVMAERFRDRGNGGMCSTSADVFACFGAATTEAAQAGALASWRIGREWLLLVDAHVGARAVTATSLSRTIEYPTAISVTGFARAQWRYR